MGGVRHTVGSMSTLLGGLTPAQFLATHWQKKPLLIRQAIPGFRGFVDADALFALARRDDVVARSVGLRGNRHRLQVGPLRGPPPGKGPWTVLVQGMETLHPEGWPLLRRFDDVVPRARLDDLMISYATEGAGVGPHTDRYDVFLLQGPGRRRWRLQHTPDLRLDESAEVPILQRFKPDVEYILDPGDMLYLPPGVAHDGTAVDGDCFTYSIGAVAPSVEGLLQNWLGFLSQKVEASVDLADMYDDPDLQPSSSPVDLGDAMLDRVEKLLAPVRQTSRTDVEEFLGRLLTGPKPHVEFPAVARLSRVDVLARLNPRTPVTLALPSRGLVRGDHVFLNGEVAVVDDDDTRSFWRELLRERRAAVPLAGLRGAGLDLVADAALKGHLRVDGAGAPSSSSLASSSKRRR